MPQISAEMVFAFLIAVILIGSILAFGIGPISDILGFGKRAQVYNEVKNIEKEVGWVFQQSKGSQKQIQIVLPAGAKLCFIDPDFPNASSWGAATWKNWPPEPLMINLTQDQYSEYYRSNVWIYLGPGDWEGYKIAYLRPEQNNFCTTGSRQAWLVNAGQYVLIAV
ncbi:MAG: hypothetical protein QW703_01695 [Candidatus Aenigmatarchaeota archaeon]